MRQEGRWIFSGSASVGSVLLCLVLAAVLASIVLAVLSPRAGAISSRIEAEGMERTAGAKVFGDPRAEGRRGLILASGGTASGSISGPTERISVRARGDKCKGAPRMVVKVDGAVVMSQIVNARGWTAYAADTRTASGEHAIKISFTNDRRSEGCDRALRLDSIAVSASDPAPAPPQAPAPAPPPAQTPRPPGGLPALSVSGNHLVQAGRQGAFNFHGVNRDTLEWGENNWGGCGGDGHFTDRDYDNMAAWGANTVRIPLSQANWLGRRCASADYARMVDEAVAKANARGMYAILDLHWSDAGGAAPCDGPSCRSGQQPMPDADSVRFWEGVAARYANKPGVVFNLYNEPYVWWKPFTYNAPDEASWRCWQNGGCTVYASEQTSPMEIDPATGARRAKPLAYTAVGMQDLYDAVRRHAPENVVLVGGLDWAYDLSGIGRGYGIRGSNIVYDTHVYTQWHNTTDDWDKHFGYLTKTHPVSATEFGSIDCSADVTRRLMDYFDAPMGDRSRRMSWTIWSWNSPGECSQPTVLADWNGTPIADQGALVHDRLRGYRQGA